MKRIVGAVALGLGVAAAVIWAFFLPPLPKGAPAITAAEVFDLLPPPSIDVPSTLAVLAANPIWGQRPSFNAPGSTDLPWRFVGAAAVHANPKAAFVLVSVDGKDAEARRVGDALPGGAIITRIRHDQICVRIDGKERTLPLSSL